MTYIEAKFTAADLKRVQQGRPLWDVFAEDDEAYHQRKAAMEGFEEQTEPDYA
jgi:hypothetical protein